MSAVATAERKTDSEVNNNSSTRYFLLPRADHGLVDMILLPSMFSMYG